MCLINSPLKNVPQHVRRYSSRLGGSSHIFNVLEIYFGHSLQISYLLISKRLVLYKIKKIYNYVIKNTF